VPFPQLFAKGKWLKSESRHAWVIRMQNFLKIVHIPRIHDHCGNLKLRYCQFHLLTD
jgi:hypothetical protein